MITKVSTFEKVNNHKKDCVVKTSCNESLEKNGIKNFITIDVLRFTIIKLFDFFGQYVSILSGFLNFLFHERLNKMNKTECHKMLPVARKFVNILL